MMRTSVHMQDARWHSWAFLYAIVSLGFSQIYLNLVQVNPRAFPSGFESIVWTLLWLQVVPFILLFGVDHSIRKFGEDSLLFRTWRAGLCAILCASLLKQLQVFHQEFYERYVQLSPYLTCSIAALLVLFLGLSRQMLRLLQMFLIYAGLLALTLPVIFVYSTRTIAFRANIQGLPAATASNHGPSIYMLVFDELSMDQLGRNRTIDARDFPSFASLANDSLWFQNATTNHWATVNSIPTILTGKVNPTTHDPNLIDLLPASYRSTLMISEIEVENWLRNRERQRSGVEYRGKVYFLNRNPLATGAFIFYRMWGFFAFALPQNVLFDDPEYHVTLKQQEDLFLNELISSERKRFVVWHCSLPHSPFLYAPDGRKHGRTLDFFPFEKEYRKSTFPLILANYHDQIRYADSILGKVVSRLKSSGAYSDSILVVTSDHGLRVWGDLFGHIESIARVPVFIRIPARKPEIVQSDFQLCDLAPTILDALGIKTARNIFDGYSALQTHPYREPAVHFYPSDVKFVFSKETNQWLARPAQTQKLTAVALKQDAGQRGFYATQVVDAVTEAHRKGLDFLQLYLHRYFPLSVSQNDARQLQQKLSKVSDVSSPANHFKRGMYFFFLATTETRLISSGEHVDVAAVNDHWRGAIFELRTAGQLSPLLAEEIEKLLLSADQNGDKRLDQTEISNIIRKR